MQEDPPLYRTNRASHKSEFSKKQARMQNLKKAKHSEIQYIMSKEEEDLQAQTSFDEAYLQFEITKAQMSGNIFDVLLAVKRYTFKGTIQQKQQKFQQWMIQYFVDKASIDISTQNFTEKIEAGLGASQQQINPVLFILYGIDFLATHNILNRCSQWNPKVRWINSSQCFLLFQTVFHAQQFLKENIKDKDSLLRDENASMIPVRNWLELDGYTNLSFQRRIFVRNCSKTDEDYIKTVKPNHESYNMYKIALKNLQTVLLKDDHIRLIFQKALDQDRIIKMLGPNQFRKIKKETMQKMDGDKQSFIQRNQKQHNQAFKKPSKPQHSINRFSLDYYKQFNDKSKRNIPKRREGQSEKYKRTETMNNSRQPNKNKEKFNWKQRMIEKKNQMNTQKNSDRIAEALNIGPLFRQNELVEKMQVEPRVMDEEQSEHSVVQNGNQLETLLKLHNDASEDEQQPNNRQQQPPLETDSLFQPKISHQSRPIPQKDIFQYDPKHEQSRFQGKSSANAEGLSNDRGVFVNSSLLSSIPQQSSHEMHGQAFQISPDWISSNNQKGKIVLGSQPLEYQPQEKERFSQFFPDQAAEKRRGQNISFDSGLDSIYSSSIEESSKKGDNKVSSQFSYNGNQIQHKSNQILEMKNRLADLGKKNQFDSEGGQKFHQFSRVRIKNNKPQSQDPFARLPQFEFQK